MNEGARRYRQVCLSVEQLAYGLDLHSDGARPPTPVELVPWEPIAVLSAEPDERERRLSITFQDTVDDLGYLRLAVLDLHDGLRVAFKRHRGESEGTGVEILPEQLASVEELRRNLFAAVNRIKDSALRQIMDGLGLTSEDFSWVKPDLSDAAADS
jgi:hypothetical protein